MDKTIKKVPHSIYLKQIPKDLMKFILGKQKEIKDKKGVLNYSQELTVYQLLRELMPK